MSEEEKQKGIVKYSKKIVFICIAFIMLYTLLQMYFSYKLSIELSPNLTKSVYAFFGSELVMTTIIKLFEKKDNNNDNKNEHKESPKG